METITEMLKRHKAEIRALQKACAHPQNQWSDWIELMIEPTRRTGFDVRICQQCGKRMDKRNHQEPGEDDDEDVVEDVVGRS